MARHPLLHFFYLIHLNELFSLHFLLSKLQMIFAIFEFDYELIFLIAIQNQ